MPGNSNIIPEKTIERLSEYRRTLLACHRQGVTHIFSHVLAGMHGITAVQVRRDLMLIGFSSDTKKGYDVKVLIDFISNILDSDTVTNIAVIGMGRYGGREVNFSSDADVIIIYRPSDNADDNQANLFARKVQEDLRAILQGPTTLEPKIELDMDLRPEGKNGPLVRSYASCEEYYRSWASTWEHQALLRARYAAGDAALAEDFLMNVADPLRYPKIDLTEAQVAEIRKLKARMEAERLPRGVRRDRHLKLGKGGLSDVEWTIQLLQLQHAGDNANLRVNGTMQALDELERRKLVSAGDAVVLRRAWWMCTAARNGSYLWSGRVNQADILPDDTYSLGGLAVYLGYDANRGQHFENDLLAVMRKARDVTERLFYGLS